MKHLDGIMKLACAELESMADNGRFRNREEIDSAYKLVDIIKDTYEVWCMEDELGGESSSFYREGRGNRGSYYEEGAYERRGRSRDSRGRFNEGAYREGSYREGMRRGSYYREGGKEEFVKELRELMENAPDDQAKQSIQKMISQMEQ